MSSATIIVREDAPWGAVIGRVTAAFAALAGVPVERLADAQTALESLAASAQAAGVRELRLELLLDGPALRTAVGLFPRGGAEPILAEADVPGVPGLVRGLVDEVSIEPVGDDEMIVLRVASA